MFYRTPILAIMHIDGCGSTMGQHPHQQGRHICLAFACLPLTRVIRVDVFNLGTSTISRVRSNRMSVGGEDVHSNYVPLHTQSSSHHPSASIVARHLVCSTSPLCRATLSRPYRRGHELHGIRKRFINRTKSASPEWSLEI
jgi:hypothetical protein